ncbi:MAG: DUF4469 domain-containing protein [Prevotellaceae bacterium]|jgi:hypothetical protein|nr:DUF4469 domain-containing protein [Prevotellaceae bacterium]
MATVLHKIRAFLYDNPLTKENPNDLIARVSSERSLGVTDVCDTAVSRGGSDISASAMNHAVDLWLREMSYQLCDGYSVNTGWFTAAPHIHGTFDSPMEKFNPEKHTLLFEFHQGATLRKELESVTVEIMGPAPAVSVIAQVVDVKTGSVSDVLTPDRNLIITGTRIKVSGEREENGIYFFDVNGTQYPVDPSDIVTNNPSEVVIVIPQLPAGACTLQIVTQYSGSVLLKEPRTVVFDKTLTVG